MATLQWLIGHSSSLLTPEKDLYPILQQVFEGNIFRARYRKSFDQDWANIDAILRLAQRVGKALDISFLKAPDIPPNTKGVTYDSEGYGYDDHAVYPSFYTIDILRHYFSFDCLQENLRWDLLVLRTKYSRDEIDDDRRCFVAEDGEDPYRDPKLLPISYMAKARGLIRSPIVARDDQAYFG